jgi:hypothetical protein
MWALSGLKYSSFGHLKKRKKNSLKLLCQSQPNFAEMILGWSPFKIVSVSAVLYPRWPPWLKIKISSKVQFWSFEEIFIFSHGGHLGYRTVLTDTILKGGHPRIISAKFGWDWHSSFRGKYFFLISSPLHIFWVFLWDFFSQFIPFRNIMR